MNEFQEKGYLVVKNLLSKTDVKKIGNNLKAREAQGSTTDDMIPNSPSFHQDELSLQIQRKLLPRIEKHSGFKLFKTYNYARIYKKGAILRIHKDRPACQISVTLDLGGNKWGVYILDKDETPVKINLNPGDGLLYYGCDVWHWREKFKGKEHSQIFFHYVDKHGQYSWAKDDIKQQP
jgi:hypothetical protein